jgi:hypothetical protein
MGKEQIPESKDFSQENISKHEVQEVIPIPEKFANQCLETWLREAKNNVDFLSWGRITQVTERALALGQNEFIEKLLSSFMPLYVKELNRKGQDLNQDKTLQKLNWFLDYSRKEQKLVNLPWEKFVKNKDEWEKPGNNPHSYEKDSKTHFANQLLWQTCGWLIRHEYYLYQLKQMPINQPHELNGAGVWEANFQISLDRDMKDELGEIVPRELIDKYINSYWRKDREHVVIGQPSDREKEEELVQERIDINKEILPYVFKGTETILFEK